MNLHLKDVTIRPRNLKLRIVLIHYYRTPKKQLLAKYVRFQTLIYGQLIPTSGEQRADFVIAIPKDSRKSEITVGKDLFGDLISGELKAKILSRSRKIIAAKQRKISAGQTVGDKDEFIISVPVTRRRKP